MTTKIAKLKKKLAATKKLVEVNNAAFKKASRAEKRVMVAKDVIARLKTKQYRATEGRWVEPTMRNFIPYDARELSLQKQIVEESEKCACCGIGAVTLSCIVFNNNATLGDLTDHKLDFDVMENTEGDKFGLKKIFSPRQLALIEIAFENGEGYYQLEDRGRLFTKAEFNKLSAQYKGYQPTTKLIAIMKNIVENNGEFVIE
jgi:hypothetical protein